ncbi:MAG: PTS glucose transporter subunit IIA [Lachnospiraceae bacterium]
MMKLFNNLFKKESDGSELQIQAFLEGEIVPLNKVPDQLFSQKILGPGIAMMPSNTVLMSPVDGTVVVVMEKTRHSCCIRSERGVEIMLHIGVNTVEMNGSGFELMVKKDQKVKAGDPLIRFSPEKILEAGYPLVTSMIVTNMGEFHHISFEKVKIAGKGSVIGKLSV